MTTRHQTGLYRLEGSRSLGFTLTRVADGAAHYFHGADAVLWDQNMRSLEGIKVWNAGNIDSSFNTLCEGYGDILNGAPYAIAFPDYPGIDLPANIPATFVDTSWENDVCPSFTSDKLGMILWIDFLESSRREFPEWSRYRVTTTGDDIQDLFQSDDWSAVLAFITQRSR